jgi:nucleotide-binding universal stress UspA family protein
MTPGGRIVVGVDGSDPSVEALRWAADLAAATAGTLTVLIVTESVLSYGAVPPAAAAGLVPAMAGRAPDAVDEVTAEAARQAGDRALQDAGLDASARVPVRTRHLTGHPATLLADASRDADLLVIGPSGHGALVGLLLGSAATYLLGHAECPVVVVRGREGPLPT